jgi:murein DD-endopeptidase MepM/ murein hydrolase activator NlpD
MNRRSPILSRPGTWVALVAVAALIFSGAVGLTLFGPGRGAAAPTASPTSPTVAQASPSGSAGLPSADPGTPSPQVTPTPQPTPPSTDKVGPAHSVDPKDLTGYVWPLHNAWITSRFAPRDFGQFLVIDGVGWHDGLDIATHCGDQVYAAHDGTVLVADRTFDQFIGYEGHPEEIYNRTVRNGHPNALAIAVVIDDGNGYRSLYMHLSEATVEPGQFVHAGDQIGKEGMTGAATGCHTHYSLIRMDGIWQDVLPRLHKYGYPLLIREHVDPLDVLPWGDQYAPARLRNQVNPPSPTPTPASPPPPTATPSPTPTGSTTPTPSA